MIIRSDLPIKFNTKAPPSTFQPRSVQTPIFRSAHSPHQFKSYQTHFFPNSSVSAINNAQDTLLRSSSHYVHASPLASNNNKLFQQVHKEQTTIVSNDINFRKKYIAETNTTPFKESRDTSLQISSDVKYLKGQVSRLRKQLQISLLQKQQFKIKVKFYQQQKQEAVNNRNKHLITLLDDYNNMKKIVQKLIEDNLALSSQNEKMRSESKNKVVKPPTAHSISQLRNQISMLKRQNSQFETDNKYIQEYKLLLKTKEQDIQNMKINQQNMQEKMRQLLDGLRFYHERFQQQKAELLDDHDNFKKSAISQITRLKRELLLQSQMQQTVYDFESDANYIKLITY